MLACSAWRRNQQLSELISSMRLEEGIDSVMQLNNTGMLCSYIKGPQSSKAKFHLRHVDCSVEAISIKIDKVMTMMRQDD